MCPQYTCMQMLWEVYGLKKMFEQLCWKEYRDHVHIHSKATRFSLNGINKGLVWHHDLVHPKAKDTSLTIPGLTFVVHLGSFNEDIVYIECIHDLTKRTVCRPRTVYVFPGYAIRHRSVREFSLTDDSRAQTPRYSLAVFFPFKKSKMMEMDNHIHERFPYYNDKFAERAQNFDTLFKNFA